MKKETQIQTKSSFMISFHPFTRNISKNSFFAKLPILTQHYPELSLFRQYIDQEKASSYQFYTDNKKQVQFYKAVFLFFGVLFSLLGLLVFFKTGMWTPPFFHISYHLIKPFILFLCGILGIAAFFVCFSMRADKEIVYYYVRKTKLLLARIYGRRKIELGLHRLFYLGRRYRQYVAFNQFYHEAKDKIYDLKEETLKLISKISASPLEKAQKEVLYNQAISELNDKLTQVVSAFKHSPSHIFNLENF